MVQSPCLPSGSVDDELLEERQLMCNEYDAEDDDLDYWFETSPNFEIGYIYIKCHGSIINQNHTVPVPEGKTIIKKNQSSCGVASKVSRYKNIELQTSINNMEIKKLIENIDTCIDLDTYRIVSPDATNDACNIMQNKDKYMIKQYSRMSSTPSENWNVPIIYNFMYFITTDVSGNVIHMYNLFERRYMKSLFKMHKWHWARNATSKSYAKELLKKLRIISPDETTQLDLSGASDMPVLGEDGVVTPNQFDSAGGYHYITTEMLFDIIKVLPYTTIKILDLSCNVIMQNGILRSVEDINYDYSDNNKIGYGGYKKTRKNKSTRRSSKRHNKKVTSKRRIRGKLRRTKHIKRSRRKKITIRA